MAKKKDLLISFCYQGDDNPVYREYRYGMGHFDEKERETVLQTGIEVYKSVKTTWNDHKYRLVKNKIWSNPSGFEIINYGYAASAAYFIIRLESDLEANIKLKEFFPLLKDKVRDGRLFADLTFGSFGNARYLMEAK